MNSLHSALGSLATTGTLYGWRIDAMLISGLLWATVASYAQPRKRFAPHLNAARA